jgi:hypothetical protein
MTTFADKDETRVNKHRIQWAERRFMRVRCAVVIFIVTLFAAPGCAVRWHLEYEEGARQAQQLNRPMLLYFKDWSSSEHREMVVRVFETPTVSNELKDTVNVELLYNWGPQAADYRITQPQVCVFIRPDGKEIDRRPVNPIPTPEEFAEWIRRCKVTWEAAAAPPGTAEPEKKKP